MFSRRFTPGSADFDRIRHEIWDDNNLGNAIPGATPRARIDVAGTLLPGPASREERPDDPRPHPCPQPLDQAVPGPGHLRPAPRPARRAALRRARRRHRPRLRPRLAPLDARTELLDGRQHRGPGTGRPGAYALKFDLVSEGIDWFERSGSQTTVKPLHVR